MSPQLETVLFLIGVMGVRKHSDPVFLAALTAFDATMDLHNRGQDAKTLACRLRVAAADLGATRRGSVIL